MGLFFLVSTAALTYEDSCQSKDLPIVSLVAVLYSRLTLNRREGRLRKFNIWRIRFLEVDT